tara:strand:- start:5245 stop:5667 length:423 start_codon:yes stop_codon:yes gene_type:complete
MKEVDLEKLYGWVDSYYNAIRREILRNGERYEFYGSSRGFFKHSSSITDVLEKEFVCVDYKIWFRLLGKIKRGRNPVESGGLFFRYDDYKDISSERKWYETKGKLLELELLVKTPFRDYYILNPKHIIKIYNPKIEYKEE